MKKIAELWNKLPAEVKVALYLAASYGLSAVVVELAKVQVSNTWLAILINILLVFLKELKPRVDRIRGIE
jgi:hypothetical protein